MSKNMSYFCDISDEADKKSFGNKEEYSAFNSALGALVTVKAKKLVYHKQKYNNSTSQNNVGNNELTRKMIVGVII